MSSIWGEKIKISVFGESHGKAVGVVIDGLPPGIEIDIDRIRAEMERRRPGRDRYSTPRSESDDVEIISGIFNGYTTGTPLCGIIGNVDVKSRDYDAIKNLMRPGHADYTGYIRHGGFADYRGGGHFSGRLTAPVVFAGAIAYQYLRKKGITIGTHILKIGSIEDEPLNAADVPADMLDKFRSMRFPVISPGIEEKIKEEIENARNDLDSVGGILETAVVNVPAGLGSPIFNSVESKISAFVFSIPAVKGLEFGSGFKFAEMRGSEANDQFTADNSIVKTVTNHTGGINGGITNGMPVVFRTVFRPTPSIGKPQQALDISKMESTELKIEGRHDPCIAVRAVPVLDAAAAIVFMDLLL
ncbi:MAG: chorismate synthase [Clostridiaceae bacterium]|nr:chorismate synthase [Clostridiaceae bacterium]